MSLRLRFALLAIASLLLLQFAAAQSDPSACAENCRFVVVPSLGPAGPPGLDGLNGVDGTNGTNGLNGKDGINGTNGIDGINGVWNDYEYFRVDDVSVKAGFGGSDFSVVSCTFVRVGRLVTLHYSGMQSAYGSANGNVLAVPMSEAQFPLRFRPPAGDYNSYGSPVYFVSVISGGVFTLGSMRVDSDGMLTFWAGAPGAAFQQSPLPPNAGWSESSVSWTV